MEASNVLNTQLLRSLRTLARHVNPGFISQSEAGIATKYTAPFGMR